VANVGELFLENLIPCPEYTRLRFVYVVKGNNAANDNVGKKHLKSATTSS